MSNLFRDDLFDRSDADSASDRSDQADDKEYDPLKKNRFGIA